jgi:hypothetical protein
MADAIDQIFVNLKGWIVAWAAGLFPEAWQGIGGAMMSALLSVGRSFRSFFFVWDCNSLRAQGVGSDPEPIWAEPGGAVWFSAVCGGRDQVVDEGGCGAAGGGRVVHFVAPVAMLVMVCWRLRCCRWTEHGGGGSGCGPVVFLCGWRGE